MHQIDCVIGDAKQAVKTDEDVIFDVANDILTKIPEPFDMELAELKYPVKWEQSMNTVLVQELLRFNTLRQVLVSSLGEMKKAVRGIVVMSDELEKIGNSLLFGKVPDKWMSASYPSLKPLSSYVSDFLRRLEFLQVWLDNSMPPVYWISGFYFTQAFLTGTLQNYSRKYTVPIDEVDFEFKMMPHQVEAYTKSPEDGAYIHGLFLDGARWDYENEVLADSLPKILFSAAPVILLAPAEKSKICPPKSYNCPVYKTSERRGILSTTGHSTNFVMWIRLPAERDESAWIMAGVALLTQLDE